MDSHNAIHAAKFHLGLLPRDSFTITPKTPLTEEEYALACLQFEAEVDSDREFAAEARMRYGSASVAMSKAMSELDLVLAVQALALSPGAVGGRFSHEQANDHARVLHFHLSAAIALDKDRRKLIQTNTPEVYEVERPSWWQVALGVFVAMIGGRSRW